MAGVIAHKQADHLRAALDRAINDMDGPPEHAAEARAALLDVLDALESSDGVVVLPTNSLLSTQQAAELLGVSRMTVVRLVDRGELPAEGAGTHRRIRADEVSKYRATAAVRRRTALDTH